MLLMFLVDRLCPLYYAVSGSSKPGDRCGRVTTAEESPSSTGQDAG